LNRKSRPQRSKIDQRIGENLSARYSREYFTSTGKDEDGKLCGKELFPGWEPYGWRGGGTKRFHCVTRWGGRKCSGEDEERSVDGGKGGQAQNTQETSCAGRQAQWLGRRGVEQSLSDII